MKLLFALVLSLSLASCVAVSPTTSMKQHVVNVVTELGHGSGVIVNAKCVVTAQHVVDGATSVTIENWTGKQHAMSFTTGNVKDDVAVVCAEENIGGSPVTFAKAMPEKFSPVSTIGFPLQYNWVHTSGEYQGDSLITAPVANGNSGGGVFDADGDYIGLIQTIAVKPTQWGLLTFAHLCGIVEMDVIKNFLDTEKIEYAVHR